MRKDSFKPGDKAPMTGWYRVHHPSHEHASEVILKQGDVFPTCPECQICPTYELMAALKGYDPAERTKSLCMG
jgi:hypothetical protein